MFETLTITTILLILFFFYQNLTLGLTSAVPKNPQDRMKFFCSECLTSVKQLLAGSTVHELGEDKISFVASNGQERQSLTLHDHKLTLQTADQPPQSLHNLGEKGRLLFEKISEHGLMVTIEACDGDACHKVAVRLEANFA